MPTFRYSEHIDRKPEEVFDFMMDFSHAKYWRSLVNRMEVVGGGAARAGSEVLVTFDVMGRQRQVVTYVTEVERPRVFAFWNENDGMRGEFRYEVNAEGTGTRVDFVCHATPRTLSRSLLLPLIRRQSRMRYAGQLANLRSAMQQRAPARPAG